MNIAISTRHAMSLIVALTLALPVAGAQATSEQRIPVRKDQQVKEAKGEVALAPQVKRLNELEAEASTLRMRLDAHDAANAARNAVFEKTIAGLRDSLRIVNDEIAALRLEIAKANAVAAAANASVEQLTQRFDKLPHFGSLFGNSGFYIGLGTGANITNGTLYDIGYQEGLNVTMPIGWSKKTFPLGFRAELGVQTFEGALNNRFVNIDPVLYTAQGMLTLNLPINNAKNNLFYLMGGGGAYFFRRVGEGSALADRLGGETKNVTKFGLTGGAGLEFHILGATSLFVQSTVTNVFAEESNVGAGGSKNMRWIPIVAGITLR